MYSIVMLAAMTAGPDVPQAMTCPVTPSKYGHGFWSKHNFYDCCAPARYGWVTCYSKGFGAYPGGGRGFYGHCGCPPTYGYFYNPGPCACHCGPSYGSGGGHGGCTFCGHGWPIGNQPAFYTSVMGCPAHMTAPPYACGTNRTPCCGPSTYAFDTGLAGHSHGVGYSGFGGYGNFGFYGGPMMHPPSTNDIPPFPHPEYRLPSAIPSGPAPMPPLPSGKVNPPLPPEMKVPELPSSPMPIPPTAPKVQLSRPAPATVVLCLPEQAVLAIEGQTISGTGRERSFRTPALAQGEDFEYEVRATVFVDGREETQTLKVRVAAGQVSRASFETLFAAVESPRRDIVTTGLSK